MSESIRLGITGGPGADKHAKAFARIEGVTLAGVSDSDESTRTELADTFGISNVHDSHRDLVQSGGIDAVVICLPTEARERAVGDAFDASLHVLCELPPAANESEMSRIVSSAGFCGKTYMWGRHERFSPTVATARTLVDNGSIGDVYRAEAAWRWGWWPYTGDDWRGDRDRAGGALLEMGTALIDSAWYSMGCPDPVEAMAASHNLRLTDIVSDPDSVADDSVFGMIRFKNGASLSLSAMAFSHVSGKASAWGAPTERDIRLFGTDATLDLVNGQRIVSSDGNAQFEAYASPGDEDDWYFAQAQEFVRAIRDEREPLNSGKQGLTLMKMLDALATSAKEKKAVPIKSTRSLDDLFGGL